MMIMQSMLNLMISDLPKVVGNYNASRLPENVVFEVKKLSETTTELLVKPENSIMRVSYCSLNNRVTCMLSLMDSQLTFEGEAGGITINDLLLKLWPVLTNLQNN